MADEVEDQEEDRQAKLTQLPQTRIRNMMKQDPDLHLANREAVYIITKATELFVEQFAKEAYKSTVHGKRKTIQKKDLVFLHPSMAYFVQCDQVLQKTYCAPDLAVTENDAMTFLEGVLD